MLTASFFEHYFIITLVLVVSCECFLTILQVTSIEHTLPAIPEKLQSILTAKSNHRIVRREVDRIQLDCLKLVIFVIFAIFMTFGKGLAFMSTFLNFFLGTGLFTQWIFLLIVIALLLLLGLPFNSYSQYLKPFPYTGQKSNLSLCFLSICRETLLGFILLIPLLALLFVLFDYSQSSWPLLATLLWLLWIVGRVFSNNSSLLNLGRKTIRLDRPRLEELVRTFLSTQHFQLKDIVVMKRPSTWRHSCVAISGFNSSLRVIVFTHAKHLSNESLLCLIAEQVGARILMLNLARLVLYFCSGLALISFLSLINQSTDFFQGLHFSASTSVLSADFHLGYTIALILVAGPILFCPIKYLINALLQVIDTINDRYVVRQFGATLFSEALIKSVRFNVPPYQSSRLYEIVKCRHVSLFHRLNYLEKYQDRCFSTPGSQPIFLKHLH